MYNRQEEIRQKNRVMRERLREHCSLSLGLKQLMIRREATVTLDLRKERQRREVRIYEEDIKK